MSDAYKIDEFGQIIRQHVPIKTSDDVLMTEFAQLEYEVLNNHGNPTKDPAKIARYQELKQQLNIEKSIKALKEAQEKIKRELIAKNKAKNNDALYTAMTTFKKTNE